MAEERLERTVFRKVTFRLMPFLCLLYVVNILDRMNISFASLFPGLDGFARAMQTYIEINAHLNGKPQQVDDVV